MIIQDKLQKFIK